MLMPKRVKRRKQHRGRRAGKASGGTVVSFGEFGRGQKAAIVKEISVLMSVLHSPTVA